MIKRSPRNKSLSAYKQKIFALLWVVPLIMVFSGGCAKEKTPELREETYGNFNYQRLLVIPFERSDNTVCALCGQSAFSCKVESDAESSLNMLLMSSVRGIEGIELISQEDFNKAVLDLPEPERTLLQTDPLFALKVARKLNADAVMRNTVFCYRERQGSAAVAGRPAAIGFHLHLYSVDDGSMVWMGKYEEEQLALSDNLLKAPEFFRRGAKWVKVEVLAEDGMKEAMKNFPAPGGKQD